MRKVLFATMAVCGLYLLVSGRGAEQNIALPTLHQIREVTLSPNYGCRPAEEFSKGYESTALFLSDYGKRRNAPDLLFNGACGSEDYFQAAMAGDDMSLVADLGADLPLEEVTATRSFNVRRVHTFPDYSKFAQAVKVEAGHTYAVLLNAHDKRGLFVFTVAEHVPNKLVRLRYAVKSYQVTPHGQVSSEGFSWGQKNSL